MIDNVEYPCANSYPCKNLRKIVAAGLKRHQYDVIAEVLPVMTITGDSKGTLLHRGFPEREVCTCGHLWPCPDYMILTEQNINYTTSPQKL